MNINNLTDEQIDAIFEQLNNDEKLNKQLEKITNNPIIPSRELLQELSVSTLKQILKESNNSTNGNKRQLIERIMSFYE